MLRDDLPVGLFRCGPEGRCISVNDRWCELSGLSAAQAAGTGWVQALHPDDLGPIMALSLVAQEEFVETALTHRFVRPDGVEVWVQSRVAPVVGLDGSPAGVLVSVTDVGDLVAARDAMAAREALLVTLLEHTADVVLRVDLDLQVTYASPAVLSVAGWAPEDVVGRSALAFVAPDDVALVVDGLASRLSRSAQASTVARRFRRADGSVLWAEASTTVEHDAAGQPIGYVVVLRDITARREAVEASQRLANVVGALPAAMYEADGEGRIRWVSDRWSALTGQPVEEAVGFGWLEGIVPADRGRALDAMAGVPGATRDIDCRMRLAGGEVRWLRLVAGPGRGPGGEAGAVVGYVADVTQRVAEQRRAAVFKRALDASSDLVVVMRVDDGTIELVNDAARDELGLVPRAEGGHQTLSDLLAPTALVSFVQRGLEAVSGGVPWHGELELRPGEARVAHLLATLTPAGDDEQGRPLVSLVARDISASMATRRQLTHQVAHDPLTGLGNRVALATRLDAAVDRAHERGDPFVLLFCDLDGFKEVNDTLGHESGDAVLVEVARRLRQVMRTTDDPCRLGGDEFVVLAEGLQPESAAALARRLVDVVAAPIDCPGGVARVGMSVGVACARGGAADAAGVLAAADAAMYRAKQAGGGRVVVADEHDGAAALGVG